MSTINKLIAKLIKKKLTISTAESCTGGLIAYSIIKNSGVSKIFTGSIICYSNSAKIKYKRWNSNNEIRRITWSK